MRVYLLIWIQESEVIFTRNFASHEEARTFLNQQYLEEFSDSLFDELDDNYRLGEELEENRAEVFDICCHYQNTFRDSWISVVECVWEPEEILNLVAEHANPHAMLFAIARLQERAIQTDTSQL